MDEPIKIIFRYKNNKDHLQYHKYIFVGNVSKEIKILLEKIEDLTLQDTWLTLTENENKVLSKFYGNTWYTKFFIYSHIQASRQKIISSEKEKSALVKKFGYLWYQENVETDVIRKKQIMQSYNKFIQGKVLSKLPKRRKTQLLQASENKEQIAGRYSYSKETMRRNAQSGIQRGGMEDDSDIFYDDEMEIPVFGDDLEITYDDIYKEDVDEEAETTSKLLEQAIKTERLIDKNMDSMTDFDISKDNLSYNEELENVYQKKYIYSIFIYKDDTINVLKQKICYAIRNHPKFGKFNFIVPDAQYLYSYYYQDNQKVYTRLIFEWMDKINPLGIEKIPSQFINQYLFLEGNLKDIYNKLKKQVRKKFVDLYLVGRENEIIFDYDAYITNNEIYLIDVYNELGTGFSPSATELDSLKNTHLKLYFPYLFDAEDRTLKGLIDYLNLEKEKEETYISKIYRNVSNSMTMENEIFNIVEKTRKTPEYRRLYKDNYITQSTILVNIKLKKGRLNLYKIFHNFVLTKDLFFLQYNSSLGDYNLVFKINDQILENMNNKKNAEIIAKSIRRGKKGLNFNIFFHTKTYTKIIKVNFVEINSAEAKIEYHSMWNKEDNAKLDNIKDTFEIIYQLLDKINKENLDIELIKPARKDFKYAYVNLLQELNIPEGKIEHNDLSEFARFFYPIMTIVVDPRKRVSKKKDTLFIGKQGTYLKYNRISNYKDLSRISNKILHLLKNYEFSEHELINRVTSFFNLTESKAIEHINKVREEHKNELAKIKRKKLKDIEDVSRTKSPGISVDIQGRDKDGYLVRVTGVKNKFQMDNILDYTNVILYLYYQTYILKKPDMQNIKEKLKNLTDIAERRNKVPTEIEEGEVDDDAERARGYRYKDPAEKGSDYFKQWSRACQNSGTKRRKPDTVGSIDELNRLGYKLNPKNKLYEKHVTLKNKRHTLYALRLPTRGDKEEYVYHVCYPGKNGEFTYIGVLNKSKYPSDDDFPCCFKKDPLQSAKKGDYFYNLLHGIEQTMDTGELTSGNLLYVMQDTAKLPENRMAILPQVLDIFMNKLLDKEFFIKNNYLSHTTGGYYFKYGVDQTNNRLLSAVSNALDITIVELRKKLVKSFEKDNALSIYTSLNEGSLRTRFGELSNFVDFLQNSTNIDHTVITDLASIPGVLTKNGVNISIFIRRKIYLESDFTEMKDEIDLICNDTYFLDEMEKEKKDNILLIKEKINEKINYNPIYFVEKEKDSGENIDLTKIFKGNNPIVQHILPYYQKNCEKFFITKKTEIKILDSLNTYSILEESTNFKPAGQYIDQTFKCKFIITKNKLILPVRRSKCIPNLRILKKIDQFRLPLLETIRLYKKLREETKNKINYKITGVFYNSLEDTKVIFSGANINNAIMLPIIPETTNTAELQKIGLNWEPITIFEKLEILKNDEDASKFADERIRNVNANKFKTESFHLFKYELSYFLNKDINRELREKLLDILQGKKTRDRKIEVLKNILVGLNTNVAKKLGIKTTEIDKSFLKIKNQLPELHSYTVRNIRNTCTTCNQEKCESNPHCVWEESNCYFAITDKMFVEYVSKVCHEIVDNPVKMKELFQMDEYIVPEIIDYRIFNKKSGEVLVYNNYQDTKWFLDNLFQNLNPDVDEKKYIDKSLIVDAFVAQSEHPLKEVGNFYLQIIKPRDITIFRAFSNAYFWNKNPYLSIEKRNLGYESEIQTKIANYFRSMVIDYILEPNNISQIEKNLKDYFTTESVMDFAKKLALSPGITTNGIVELYTLSKIFKVPIYIYEDIKLNKVLILFKDGIKFMKDKINTKGVEKYWSDERKKNGINLLIEYDINNLPVSTQVIYIK